MNSDFGLPLRLSRCCDLASRKWDPDSDVRKNLNEDDPDGEMDWQRYEAYANYLNELLQQMKRSDK